MRIEDLDKLPTVHYSQIPEPAPDSPLYREVQTFRRELPRLLIEGYQGKWALIKGDEVIALYDTFDEGYRAGWKRYLLEPFAVQPVREQQPALRVRTYS